MSALQKLKAYFGMVPADELDDYDDDRYGGYGSAYQPAEPEFDTYGDRIGGARRRPLGSPRPVSRLDPAEEFAGYDDDRPRAPRRPWTPPEPPAPTHRTVTPVRGALAVEPQVEPPLPRTRPPAPEPAPHPLSKITTLHPRSYMEARTIGERYRDGAPVIMNLTDLDDADARRLVDFAAGLAFAMRGSMDKVTNKVFLISPPDIDVTAEDRRRIAEGGFFS
ncbi:MAG TPA: cell division protein SepF [Pseudonocardiaceae bacterium]|nr:cell division protein SepF [Pseudonocardiaceae bacterium]